MSEELNLTNEEQALEARLAMLSPAAPRRDAMAVAFAAGVRAGRREQRAWQLATLAFAACFLVVVLWPSTLTPRSPRTSDHALVDGGADRATDPEVEVVFVSTPAAPPSASRAAGGDEPDYLKLRNAVLDHGLVALAVHQPGSARAAPQPAFGASAISRRPRSMDTKNLLNFLGTP